jgi:VWFA-related protein
MAEFRNLPGNRFVPFVAFSLLVLLAFGPPPLTAQSGTNQAGANQSQPNAQGQPPQTPGDQSQTKPPGSDQDIPDAPSAVQPPPPPAPIPQPANPSHTVQPAQSAGDSGAQSTPATQPPPKMPPVQTVPPGSIPRNQLSTNPGIYKIPVSVNFVLIPVMVKDSDGRLVDGLLPKDFTVLENGRKQTLTYFTSDPFQLSVAVVLDTGMPEVVLSKVDQTYTSLAGAFSPYDEFALYTFSSTVSQVLDFTNRSQRLADALNEIKLVPGNANGPLALNDPYSVGPTVNGVPVNGPPIAPVQTPPREAHVLNDAILRAAIDLGKQDRSRRKVILVISDGHELGSSSSYRDVLRVLETRNIQIQAVVVGGGALPVWKQVGRFRLKDQGYWDLLPKYSSATGGGQVFSELTRNSIEEAYARITNDARNQYTMGYAAAATASTTYRSIEVLVDKRGLKVSAKDGYYPAPSPR